MSRQKCISGSIGVPWMLLLAAVVLSLILPVMPASAANFGAASNVAVPGQPNSIASGKFNAGASNDLVFASESTNTLKFLQNNAGVFTSLGSGLDVSTGGGDGPFAVAVADFDKDGKDDVAVANIFSNNVSVFLRQGDGTFYAATVYNLSQN